MRPSLEVSTAARISCSKCSASFRAAEKMGLEELSRLIYLRCCDNRPWEYREERRGEVFDIR